MKYELTFYEAVGNLEFQRQNEFNTLQAQDNWQHPIVWTLIKVLFDGSPESFSHRADYAIPIDGLSKKEQKLAELVRLISILETVDEEKKHEVELEIQKAWKHIRH